MKQWFKKNNHIIRSIFFLLVFISCFIFVSYTASSKPENTVKWQRNENGLTYSVVIIENRSFILFKDTNNNYSLAGPIERQPQ